MKSLLLVRLGGLGDLLAVLPACRLVRALRPDSRSTLVCREEYGSLFLRSGVVDGLESQDGPPFSGLFAGSGPIPEESASWLASFALVLGWTQGRVSTDLRTALERSGVANRFLEHDPGSGRSIARHFFEATRAALDPEESCLSRFEDNFGLPLTDDLITRGRALAAKHGLRPGAPYVVFHPGSGGARKRWPLDRFMETADVLSGDGWPGLFVTGEAEADLAACLSGMRLPPLWRHAPSPDILDLAGLLAGSALFLGNDSGVTHLAAFCGAQVLAVFRKETAPAWRPEGRSRVLIGDEPGSVPVSDVSSAARNLLSGP